ncbi:MAG: hypothetical protein RTV31_06380 [Candidatus Thorarchaeota archaeon]
MRKKKGTKNIDDVSVSKLLDDFVDLDVEDEGKKPVDMADEEYISMMLKKDAARKLERMRKEPATLKHEDESKVSEDLDSLLESCQSCFYCTDERIRGDRILCACTNVERELESKYVQFKWWVISQSKPKCWKSPPCDAVDDILQKYAEVESVEEPIGKQREPAKKIVIDEVIESHDVEDAVEPKVSNIDMERIQEELTSRTLKRKARETLEKHRKKTPAKKKKGKQKSPVVSEKISPVKRCQNCYFCVGEKKISGSCWCHCTNPGRSSNVEHSGSWVKSKLNLHCWKPPQE